MPASNTEIVHYTAWGCSPSVCGKPFARNSMRHEHVTCEDCKATPLYRNHVFQREIAFDGKFSDWQAALKERYFKGEKTDD